MKRFVLLALASLASPTMAGEAHLNGMAEAIIASEWADPIALDDYLFEPIEFDHPDVQSSVLPDTTYFSQVVSVFGGTAHSEEIFEGTVVTWVCYETGHGRTTFISLAMGEGDETVEPSIEPGPLVSVIVEQANAPANPACSTNVAAAAPLPGNEIPRLGATRWDLFIRFESRAPERDTHLAYFNEVELGDEESWFEQKTIYYRLQDGIVTGVAYKITTRPGD